MPRCKRAVPTFIYWLIDTRTEPGRPFYCGKTIRKVEYRLKSHLHTAAARPNRALSVRLFECGESIRVQTMEVVPIDGDWAARERHWIAVLRGSFPEAVNIARGGEGAPGNIHTPEWRAFMSNAMKG